MRRFLWLSLCVLVLASIAVASSAGVDARSDLDPLTSMSAQARGSFDMSPAWSPDGRLVAFARSTELANGDFRDAVYIVSVESGEQRVLAAGDAPSLSPDGSRITFHVWWGGNGIYTVKLDGTGRRRLTKLSDSYPRWSPDGKNILFWRKPPGDVALGATPLFVVPSSGGSARRVGFASEGDAEWSPDGTRIVFWAEFHAGETAIMVVGRNGRGLRNLGYGAWPSWSPDGRDIAFTYAEDGFGIRLMRSDGSHVRRLGAGWLPHFSPTGRELSFSIEPGDGAIWIMRVDGSHRRRLTQPPARQSDHDEAWSPDGRKLVFVRGNRIWVTNSNGTNARPLSH